MKTPILARTIFAASIAAVIAIAAAPAMAADQPVHVRGTITDVTAAGFTVQTDSGSKSIALQPDTRITGVVPSSLDQIKPGTFIGTANVKRNGVARALEVVVFPDSMKGTGLGDYVWDLSARARGRSAMSGSAMTNGTVKMSQKKSPPGMHSTMTNGTVKTANSGNGMTLLVDYGKGSKVITVPSNVPVVAFQPADKGALIKGAHVFVVAKPGKPLNAAVVAVGINGTVPPM